MTRLILPEFLRKEMSCFGIIHTQELAAKSSHYREIMSVSRVRQE